MSLQIARYPSQLDSAMKAPTEAFSFGGKIVRGNRRISTRGDETPCTIIPGGTDEPSSNWEASFSPDGNMLAVTSHADAPVNFMRVYSWTNATWTRVALSSSWHPTSVARIAWSPSGNCIAVMREMGGIYAVCFYKLSSSKVFTRISVTYLPEDLYINRAFRHTLAWHPNGRELYFTCGVGALVVHKIMCDIPNNFALYQGEVVGASGSPTVGLGVSPDGRTLAVGYQASNQIRLFRFDKDGLVLDRYLIHPDDWNKESRPNSDGILAWHPDGIHLATGIGTYPGGGGISIWNTETNTRVASTSIQAYEIEKLAWSPCGNLLAVSCEYTFANIYTWSGKKLEPAEYQSRHWRLPNGDLINPGSLDGILLSRRSMEWHPSGNCIVQAKQAGDTTTVGSERSPGAPGRIVDLQRLPNSLV